VGHAIRVAGLVVVAALAACGGASGSPEQGATPRGQAATGLAATTTSATATTPETPAADKLTVVVDCRDASYQETSYETYQEAWSAHYSDCDGRITVEGESSTSQDRAVLTAYGQGADPKSLLSLYGLCAESGPGAWSYGAGSDGFSADQAREVEGMLILCPDHPDRALLRRYLAASTANQKLVAQGRAFNSGTYLVSWEPSRDTLSLSQGPGCLPHRRDDPPVDFLSPGKFGRSERRSPTRRSQAGIEY
jgi:hypothetical protein